MPVHRYECRQCGSTRDFSCSIENSPPQTFDCECGGRFKRLWDMPSVHSFATHWNPSVGTEVTSRRDFDLKLYEAQEKMTERLGFQQSYRVKEPGSGATDEGMKETHDVRKAQGLST